MDIKVTKQLLQSAGDTALFVTQAVKRGWKTTDLFRLMQMASDIMQLVQSGKDLLPELKDIDAKEAGQLAELTYKLVKDVYDVAVQPKK